jgi:spore maturation protein CgeB
MIPYSRENQHGVDPIKFYEYLAMEKPVVTSDIGGVGQFKDYPQVCVARDHSDFIRGLEFFLKKIERGESIGIKPLPEWCSWKYKAHKIIESIQMKMN